MPQQAMTSGQTRTLLRVAAALFLAATLWGVALWVLTPTPAFAQDGNGITSPTMGAPVRGIVAVEGIAIHPEFRKWQLDLLLDGDPENASFLAIGEAAAPMPAILAGWDTNLYPDGNHLLRLRVVHTNLNYDEYITPVRVRNSTPIAVSLIPVQSAASIPTTVAALTATVGLTRTDAVTLTIAVSPTTELTATRTPTSSVEITASAPVTDPAYLALFNTGAPADGRKLIEIDLSDQTLTAWQGDVMVFQTSVSTGKPDWWTLPGTFETYLKYEKTRMRGGRDGDEYDTPDVPWTMYYDGDFAIHGAYWHNNFGTPVSHGCVNLRVEEAKALYAWAPLGTTVTVHP